MQLTSRLNSYLVPISLFGYYVISFAVDDPSSSRTITAPYRAFILMLNIILAGLYLANSSKKRVKKYRLNKKDKLCGRLIFLFIVMYSIRLIYSGYISPDNLSKPPAEYIIYWLGISLIPCLCFFSIKEKNSKIHLSYCWIILGISTFLGLQASQSLSDQFSLSGRFEISALNPISMGHAGVSFSLISIFLWLNPESSFLSRIKMKRLYPLIVLCSSLLGIYLALLASSRGPVLSFLICILLLVSSYRITIKKLISYTLLGTGAICALTFVSNQGASIIARFQNSNDFQVDSIAGHATRGQLMGRSIQLFLENPLFGSGLEVSDLGSYTHNLIIESFMATGFLGGICFTTAFVYAFIKSIGIVRDARERVQWGWIALLYIQYSVSTLLSGTLYSTSIFWYLLIGIISLHTTQKSAKSRPYLKYKIAL